MKLENETINAQDHLGKKDTTKNTQTKDLLFHSLLDHLLHNSLLLLHLSVLTNFTVSCQSILEKHLPFDNFCLSLGGAAETPARA